MITEEIVFEHDSTDLIQKINRDFPNWIVRDMGSGKHYHFISKNKKEKGVVEISFPYEFHGRIVLKIAENRKSSWSLNALSQLKSYIKSHKN